MWSKLLSKNEEIELRVDEVKKKFILSVRGQEIKMNSWQLNELKEFFREHDAEIKFYTKK